MPRLVRCRLCVGVRVALLPLVVRVPVQPRRVRVPLAIARPALTGARLPLARPAAFALALLALPLLALPLLALTTARLPLAVPVPGRAVRLGVCRALPVGCELPGCRRTAARRAGARC